MTHIMRAADFNRMRAAAIDMLERYHAGADFDPETLTWARDLLTANPTPKRTPPRGLDQVAELFTPEFEACGMTVEAMAQIAPHLNAGKAESRHGTLYKLLNRLCKAGQLFMLRRRRESALYFLTAQARDDVRMAPQRAKEAERAERRAKFAAALEAIPKPKKRTIDLQPHDLADLPAPVVRELSKKAQKMIKPPNLFNPKTPTVKLPASGSVFIPPPPPVRAPSPTIDPDDPRIQRAPTPRGRFEVTEADVPRMFGASKPGTNPMTGRAWE